MKECKLAHALGMCPVRSPPRVYTNMHLCKSHFQPRKKDIFFFFFGNSCSVHGLRHIFGTKWLCAGLMRQYLLFALFVRFSPLCSVEATVQVKIVWRILIELCARTRCHAALCLCMVPSIVQFAVLMRDVHSVWSICLKSTSERFLLTRLGIVCV